MAHLSVRFNGFDCSLQLLFLYIYLKKAIKKGTIGKVQRNENCERALDLRWYVSGNHVFQGRRKVQYGLRLVVDVFRIWIINNMNDILHISHYTVTNYLIVNRGVNFFTTLFINWKLCFRLDISYYVPVNNKYFIDCKHAVFVATKECDIHDNQDVVSTQPTRGWVEG